MKDISTKTIKVKGNEPIFFLDQDVTYAKREAWFGHVTRDLKMDIIYPQTDKKQYPCIVWICGGAWMQMDKGAHTPYLAELARKGFAVASVEYRLAHEAPFPGALSDIKAAIRYLRANAKRYSINADKFGVMGESAGGYLAAMTALADNKEFDTGEYLKYSSAVQAACPWYMPCDMAELMKKYGFRSTFFNGDFNDPKYAKFINPVSYISKKSPPFLLFHGTNDTTVPISESHIIHNALLAKNIESTFIILKDAAHADHHFFQKQIWDMIEKFFKDKLY